MKQFVLLTVMTATASLGTAWAGANVWTSLGPDGGVARSLVIDPLNPNTVYALTNAGLFKSTDGGANWGLTPPLPPNSPNYGVVLALVIDPQNPTTLYAETTEQFSDSSSYVVLKSTDGGGSWRKLKSDLFWISHSLAIDPEDPRIIYSVGYTLKDGNTEILKSTDGGETWKSSFSRPPGISCCVLVIDRQNPSTVYAVTPVAALFKSTNRGASWNAVYSYPGRGQEPSFYALAIDAQDSNTLYARSFPYGGHYKSTDGGASWSTANSGLPGGDEVNGNNLDLRGLTVHPQIGGTLYVANGGILFKSTDGAANWTKLDSQPGDGNVQSLAIDPQKDGTLYASAYAGVHKSTDGAASWTAATPGIRALAVSRILITPEQPATLYINAKNVPDRFGVLDYGTLLLRSTDGGKSWNQLESRYLLAIDPQDPATLFGFGAAGVSKSKDRGTSWIPANAGLPEGPLRVSSLVIDPRNTPTLYAGFVTEGRDAGGIWKSTDGAANWTKLDSQPAVGGVQGLEIDPNTHTLYAWNGMGLFMSTDRGGSWSKLRSGPVYGLTIDPQSPRTLYVVMYDEEVGVFKSIDGGESWSTVNAGLPAAAAGALVIDPLSTGTLYAPTAANGVYQTTDGGANWSAVNSSGMTTLNVYTLAIDTQTSTVYAGTAGGVFAITYAAQ